MYIKKKESGTVGGNAGEGKYLTRARAVNTCSLPRCFQILAAPTLARLLEGHHL